MATNDIVVTASALAYPRTGKRGVPQQFARRLYELLEGEAKLMASNPEKQCVISWSESGTAFQIFDIDLFASTVLPLYFRTKKFSSFQRNLNLYGFTKVRRGPDVDMYAHPSFIRGKPENLSQIRKTTAAARRSAKGASVSPGVTNQPTPNIITDSPTLGPMSSAGITQEQLLLQTIAPHMLSNALCSAATRQVGPTWISLGNPAPVPTQQQQQQQQQHPTPVPIAPMLRLTKSSSKGMLDLLALAVEHNETYKV